MLLCQSIIYKWKMRDNDDEEEKNHWTIYREIKKEKNSLMPLNRWLIYRVLYLKKEEKKQRFFFLRCIMKKKVDSVGELLSLSYTDALFKTCSLKWVNRLLLIFILFILWWLNSISWYTFENTPISTAVIHHYIISCLH